MQKTWKDVNDWLEKIEGKYGPNVHLIDWGDGHVSDWLEAICREAYGVNWGSHPNFHKMNEFFALPDHEVFAAMDRIEHEQSDWIDWESYENIEKGVSCENG